MDTRRFSQAKAMFTSQQGGRALAAFGRCTQGGVKHKAVLTATITLVAATWVQHASAGGIDTTGISDRTWELGIASERVRAGGDSAGVASKYSASFNYGLTSYWSTEIAGELAPGPDGGHTYEATAWSNKFVLPTLRDTWPGLGFVVGYAFPTATTDASTLEMKLIADKSVGAWTHAINVGSEQPLADLGKGAQFTFAYTTRWALSPLFAPAIEIFREFEPSAEADGDEGMRLGPAFSGSYSFGKHDSVNYEAGYLYGITGDALTTLKAKISYSVAF